MDAILELLVSKAGVALVHFQAPYALLSVKGRRLRHLDIALPLSCGLDVCKFASPKGRRHYPISLLGCLRRPLTEYKLWPLLLLLNHGSSRFRFAAYCLGI